MDKRDKSITLEDPITKATYTISVTSEEFYRAHTDTKFAQSLLDEAKNSDPDREISNNQEDLASSIASQDEIESDATYLSVDSQISKTKKFWQYDETKLLISCIENHIDDLSHPKKRKTVFEVISNELLSNGFVASANECSSKWKSLIRSYKASKDNKNKTGRGSSRFMFYDLIDNILGDRPNIQCNHILESSNNENISNELEEYNTNSMESNDEIENSPGNTLERATTTKRKRQRDGVYEKFVAIKKKEYENREIRHKDRMQLEERKINLLESFLKQITEKK